MKYLNKEKSLLLYKYLLSYFIIFLIPYITISIIFYQVSVQNLRHEIISSNIDKIEQVIDITDSRMEELRDIATRISLDHHLTPYMLNQPYNSKEAIEKLISYKVSSAIVDELYLYYHDEEQIYSPRGTSGMTTFIENTYRLTDAEEIKLRTQMEAISSPVVQSIDIETDKEDQQQVISYLYPVPVNSTASYGTVAFFIKEIAFKKLIQNALGEFKGNMYIFNDKKDLLTSHNNGEKLDPKYLNRFNLEEKGVVDKKLDNENYSLVTVHSDSSGWTFVSAMPTDQFYERMTSLKTSIILTLILIALIGMFAAIFMALRQYRPIKNIAQSLNTRKIEHSIKTKNKDELDKIRESIETMYQNSREMHKKIQVQQPFLRDQLLTLLLKENTGNHEEMKRLLTDLDISFKGDYYFIVMISFHDKIVENETIEERERLLDLLMKMSDQYCIGYGVELVHENGVALITSIKGKYTDLEKRQQNFVKELGKQLEDYCHTFPSVGVGKIYEGTNGINRSFIEANAALEYIPLNNRNIVYFGKISESKEDHNWYSLDDQAKFSHSLKQGNKAVAKETLAVIMKNFKEQDISIYMLRAICFDLINIILKNMVNLGLSHKTDDVKALVEFNSLEDLEKKINFMIVYICEVVDLRKESHNNYLRDHILNFINENYKKHDLSLEYTAEHFQISTSHLSRFIKEHTGTTFTQYLWELRNEECKRQLVATNQAIKEIVLDIGYVDVANFTRKFKKVEGVTPGQYRKDYKFKNAL
ncbi:helix-turn-helix domain-containing protein [Gracilibacillus timonensis]|uniref:helix-turn-helix domain-containing protein n=1 Tax=Gracilibacillus timonensis TaxID=1816696 RepID=UPI000826D85D|nr:helix-turn-helix domain-containing protein [Gracilibacillus timonensis]